jgi:hypothetical protein
MQKSSERLTDDWVHLTRQLFPALVPSLDRAEIRDAAGYLEREAGLSFRVRSELGRIRHDLMLIGRCEIRDQARAAPPWIRELPLSEMRVPARIRDALAPHGVSRLCDLDHLSDGELLRMGPLTRSGLRTLSLAVLSACRSEPPRRSPSEPGEDRLQSLIRSAPEGALEVRIEDLIGLRPRPVSSLLETGVQRISDLAGKTERDVLALPGFGRGNLDDLVRAVQREIEEVTKIGEVERCPDPAI